MLPCSVVVRLVGLRVAGVGVVLVFCSRASEQSTNTVEEKILNLEFTKEQLRKIYKLNRIDFRRITTRVGRTHLDDVHT